MNLPIQQITGANEHPEHVGQFKIVGQLGKGAQSVVYLAQDSQLQRQVAIKTLNRRQRDYTHLLHEARNVSKLKHPNIIPIYEIGVHEDMPYLVYQFCEGQSLRNVLKSKGKFKTLEAVDIIRHVLDAMDYAHRSGIVHRDLNPANIMIDNNNAPRIMDFGISIMMGTLSPTSAVAGTVNYMAPEQIANNEIGPSVDIFAIGLMLYEMLTGHQVFSADHCMAITYKITNENILAPSSREPSIDKKLDEIVMQALERNIKKRFNSAEEMKNSIDLYARLKNNKIEGKIDGNSKSTVKFLLRRMQRKQDFPAISANISQINKKTSNRDSASASEISNVILRDYALTTKILRLVNSSMFRQFGGEITTISRAVVILGVENVQAATLSIVLFDHLNNSTQEKELKKATYSALMSGIIARQQAKRILSINDNEKESAFIASMLHTLGNMLVIYYLPEEYADIRNMMVNKDTREQQAVLSVLGASYEDLGKAIAEEWKLPEVISNSMRKMPEGQVAPAKSVKESIRQLASFANELCAIGARNGNKELDLANLASRYKKALKVSVKDINKLIKFSQKEIKSMTKGLNINTEDITLFTNRNNADFDDGITITTTKIKTAREENGAQIPDDKKANQNTTAAAPSNDDEQTYVTTTDTPYSEIFNHHDIIAHGIAEITSTMLEDYNLNDVLSMVLETMYRGMGFTRVLFCIHDVKNNSIIGRFGFGKNIDEVISGFRYKLDGQNDVLVDAVRNNREYIILDINSSEYRNRVPAWLQKLTMPRSMVIYPVTLSQRCIGLIYADTDTSSPLVSTETLRFFKPLRNQATLAIHQKQM
ncbi:MAG: protein kinase [Gammaproteobacteria bacterium]|nr:protein kinase [Gammaproteobacteria bacterium]